MTQEELEEILLILTQAVNRWKIDALCRTFRFCPYSVISLGITSDSLLGIDVSSKKRKSKNIGENQQTIFMRIS